MTFKKYVYISCLILIHTVHASAYACHIYILGKFICMHGQNVVATRINARHNHLKYCNIPIL